MSINLRGRHFLNVADFTKEELNYLLELAFELKRAKMTNNESKNLEHKNIVLLFQKDSTRTRCAFEVAAYDQGAHVTYIGPSGSHIGTKESIADTAKVLSRMYDGIEFRGFEHQVVEELAANSSVPVWNGLTNEWHPTQMLADFLTIKTNRNIPLSQVKLAYFGDARNNMANSYIIMGAKMGMEVRIAAPKEYWPSHTIIDAANKINQKSRGKLIISDDPIAMVQDVDVIATDAWLSMGDDKTTWIERIKTLKTFQVNSELVSYAKKDYMFLHCLPAFHDLNPTVAKELYTETGFGKNGFEVSEDVFNSKHSYVFEEAENRLHTIKAVMLATIGNI